MIRDEIPKVDVLLSDEITKDLRTMKVKNDWMFFDCRMWFLL